MRDIGLVSDKLDYHIRISLSISQEMGLFFAKFEDAVPLYATLNEDSAEISLFLDEELRKKFDPAFGKFTQTSRGKFDILHLRAEDLIFEFQVFKDLMRIPSVVPGGFYLKEGWVYADFRFHHSSLPAISNIVKQISEARNRIHLSRLCHSTGLEDTLRGISTRIPITDVSFSYVPEAGYMSKEMLDSDPVGEAKLFSSGMESEYDVILYSGKTSSKSFTVDSGEGIQETHFSTNFMKTLMKEIRKEKIPLASVIGKFYEGEIMNHFFLPSFIADELLELIFRVGRENSVEGLKIVSFVELSQEDFPS